MKFNAILRQFEAALKSHYADWLLPGICQAINALLRCRTEAAGAHSCTARIVMRRPFNRVPVGIGVVANVKTRKRHNGLTVNSQNYCPSSILW